MFADRHGSRHPILPALAGLAGLAGATTGDRPRSRRATPVRPPQLAGWLRRSRPREVRGLAAPISGGRIFLELRTIGREAMR
jgi:hypothetical protein